MAYTLNLKGSTQSNTGGYDKQSVLCFGNRIYIGSGTAGYGNGDIASLTFDGSTYSVQSTKALVGIGYATNINAIASDGNYLYVGGTNPQRYLWGLALDANGDLTGASASVNIGSDIQTIAVDSSGYIYVGCTNGYVYAYTFDGSSFTLRGSVEVFLGYLVRKIIYTNGFIHVACAASVVGTQCLEVFTFDGTNFSSVAIYSTSDDVGAYAYGLFYDGQYFFTCNGGYVLDAITFDGISSYSKSGNSLSLTAVAYNSTGDSQYLYVLEHGVGVKVNTFDGSDFSLISSYLDTNINQTKYNLIDIDSNGYVHYCSDSYVKALRLDLAAQFTVDKTRVAIGESVQFTLV